MNIKITLEATPELQAVLEKIAGAFGVVPSVESKPAAKENPKKETPKEDKPAEVKEKKKEETKPVEKTEPASSYTLDTITTRTKEFIQGNPDNRAKLKSFLTEKGLARVSELPESEYDAAIAFFEENS